MKKKAIIKEMESKMGDLCESLRQRDSKLVELKKERDEYYRKYSILRDRVLSLGIASNWPVEWSHLPVPDDTKRELIKSLQSDKLD
jgi:hypothetical protein